MLYVLGIYLVVLVIATVLTNQRIKNNQTENLFPYGFVIGLSGSLVAVVFVTSPLLKKISNETHRKTFFNATLVGLVASFVLFGILNMALATN